MSLKINFDEIEPKYITHLDKNNLALGLVLDSSKLLLMTQFKSGQQINVLLLSPK